MWLNKVFRPETRPAARIAWQRRKLQDVRRTRSGCGCWLINGSLGGATLDLFIPTYIIKEYQGYIYILIYIYINILYTAYLFFVCVHIFVYLEYTRRHLLAYACTFGIWIWKHLRLIYMLPSSTRQHHLHNCTPTGCNQQRHAAHRHTICGGILPYALYLATGSPEEASGTWAP